MRSASIPAPVSEAAIFFVVRVLLGNQPAPRQTTNPTTPAKSEPKTEQKKTKQKKVVEEEEKKDETQKPTKRKGKAAKQEKEQEEEAEGVATGVQWVVPEHTGELVSFVTCKMVALTFSFFCRRWALSTWTQY